MGLTPEEAQLAWTCAVEAAGGRKITARAEGLWWGRVYPGRCHWAVEWLHLRIQVIWQRLLQPTGRFRRRSLTLCVSCKMKPYSAVFTTMMMGARLLATEQGECQEITSEIVKRAFVGDAFFVGFLPKTNGWLSVDTSSDLHIWTMLASVATTNDVTAFVDENRTTVSMRFYRLRQPGTSVDEAEARWLQHASGDYQFHLQHIRSYASPSVLDADVIVRAGQKEVTNVQAEGEQPLQQPTASDFPAVPELFDLLREAQQSGCWRVAVTYDRAQGFPSWCVIERLAGGFSPKQIDGYRITGFTFTPTD